MPKKPTKKATKKTATKKNTKKVAKKAAKKATKKSAKKSAIISHEEISHLAYLNFIKRIEKGVDGDEESDWLDAEQSLKKEN